MKSCKKKIPQYNSIFECLILDKICKKYYCGIHGINTFCALTNRFKYDGVVECLK